MWNGGGFHQGFGWMGGGGIGMGLFWILVIVVVVLLVRSIWGGRDSAAGGDATPRRSALDILRERYARGEIDREEFEQKRRDLSA